MRAVVQRVRRASVAIEGETPREIGAGLLVLVGVAHDDGESQARWIAQKCAHLRVFEDDAGKMNRSLLDTGGAALVVSQFTLYGDARKGRRPSFVHAAPPEVADPLYRRVAALMREEGVGSVETGTFQAHMVVSLENDGPVTLVLDSPPAADA